MVIGPLFEVGKMDGAFEEMQKSANSHPRQFGEHSTLLEKFWRTVCDVSRYCKALCDVKLSQIDGNSR